MHKEYTDDEIISASRDGVYTGNRYRSNPAARRRRRNHAAVAFWIILACVVLIIGSFVLAWYYLRVKTIDVEGASYYDPQQLAEDSGVSVGEHLLSINTKKLSAQFLHDHPYASAVTYKIGLPNKVVINVTESVPAAYLSLGETTYLLSGDMRVLDTNPASAAQPDGLIRLQITNVDTCVLGGQLTFQNVLGAPDCQLIGDVISQIQASVLASQIVSLDMSNKFAITAYYTDRFKILLGDDTHLSDKLQFAQKIIAQLYSTDTGTIDVTDYKQGSLILGQM